MLIIGERINSSRSRIASAIEARDEAYIREEALAQVAAGADYLDVNAGSMADREVASLTWLIEMVQEAVDVPLCIDSPDPSAITAVLPIVKMPPIINSVTLESARLDPILRLTAQYGAKVIALCQGDSPMVATTEEKVRIADRLIEKSLEYGLSLDDVYVDPLVYPLSTDSASAVATIDAIAEIMALFRGVHTTCGLSNVSYGLPNRSLINRSLLIAALVKGLDSVVMDPTDNELYGSLKAGLMVCNRDEFCMDYISAYREGRLA